MKKPALLFLLAIAFCLRGHAQDYSLDDLIKLRTATASDFETSAHEKGYNLDHMEYNACCMVYLKKSNLVSQCDNLDKALSNRRHLSVKFETNSKKEFEALKADAKSKLKYVRTVERMYRSQHYLEHIYCNDQIVVRMYDIAYKFHCQPSYEVTVSSIYSMH